MSGPEGGTIHAIVRDPVSGALYAATGYQHGYNKTAGSVFKSVDNGDHWTYVSQDFFLLANPINTRARTLAVNTSGDVFAGLENAGVWRSIDAGVHWSPFSVGLSSPMIRAVAVSQSDETLAATESSGVFRLSGSTWTAHNTGLTNLSTRCLAFASGFALVGTASAGIFKRPNGGSWTDASAGLSDLRINGIYVSPTGARILACTETGLFESLDQAASWHPVVGPFAGSTVWTAVEVGAQTLVAAGTTLYLYDQSTTQWTMANSGYTGAACRVLFNDNSGRIFAGSFDDGLFRSVDGAQSWTAMNHGLYGHTVLRLLATSAGGILAGTNRNGIFRSTVLSDGWTAPSLQFRNIFALAEGPGGDLFAGNYNTLPGSIPDGHAWRSSDGGANWTPLDNGITASMVSGFVFPDLNQVICSLAWHPAGVRTSTTNGEAWTQLMPAPGNEAYCIARNTQGDLFIGSEGHGVLRFNAASQTWTNLGLINQSQQFSIVINSQGHVFVGNDGNVKGVYKSTANGDALAPLNTFPSNYGYVIVCLPNDDLYVGTRDAGIQYSNDGGASWTTANNGIPVSSCQALALGPDGHLYAGVAGFGVYRSMEEVVPQLTGDIDGDGDVDDVDVSLFTGVLLDADQSPIHIYRSDMTTDGKSDGNDIPSMIGAYLGN